MDSWFPKSRNFKYHIQIYPALVQFNALYQDPYIFEAPNFWSDAAFSFTKTFEYIHWKE